MFGHFNHVKMLRLVQLPPLGVSILLKSTAGGDSGGIVSL